MKLRTVLRPEVVLAAVVLAIACPASAQTIDASAATELFNAGRDLMKQGDFTAACPKLAESARLDAKVGTLARLAECEEKLGHMASARGRWEQAVNLARAAHDDRLAHCEAEFARIDKVVPKLKLSYRGTPPDGLTLTVGQLQVGAGSLGVALPVDAGSQVIAASAPGYKAWSSTVVTKADGVVTAVEVPGLGAEGPKPVPVAPPTPEPHPLPPAAPPTGSSSPLPLIGLVTAGVGIVGLGVGTVFALNAKSKLDQSNQQGCDANNNCPGASFATRNDARSAGNLATVFFAVGGVLVAGGLTLWLVAPRKQSTSSASLELAPGGGPGIASMGMRGSF